MKKLLKMKMFGASTLFILGILAGCSGLFDNENDAGVKNNGKGTVVIKLTDAPFPADLVAEANVTIDWIKLLPESIDSTKEENGNGWEEDSSVVVVEIEEPQTINLLELSNGITETLAEVDAPAGIYREIRLHVVDAGIILKSGESFDLKVPGGHASGLKVKINPALEMTGESFAEVLLDFDVSRSFVMRGNINHKEKGKINGFIFKPVIRAVAHVQTSTGEVSGMVTDSADTAVENALLTLIENGDTVTSAITSEGGTYAMIGIPPGDYRLTLNLDGYEEQVSITVEAGAVTTQNFVVDSGEGEQETGGISGAVSDTSGVVIENVMLTLFADEDSITSTNTDDQGLYSFTGIVPGDYNLVCEIESYVSQDSTVTVVAGEVTGQNFVLVKEDDE